MGSKCYIKRKSAYIFPLKLAVISTYRALMFALISSGATEGRRPFSVTCALSYSVGAALLFEFSSVNSLFALGRLLSYYTHADTGLTSSAMMVIYSFAMKATNGQVLDIYELKA